jgi:acyl-CoA synthetase (AMP-forming)/AMP-acid ligase II
MIKSGGLNVYPAEVEGVLASHPRVEEAAVVAAPDERWGEAVVAFVRTDGQCEAEELAAWCSERLAGFKRPKQYRFVDSMPKGETGKILKRALRELLSQD